MPAVETGPYLLAAVICEKVMQERDGVTSLVRIIDRFTFDPPPNPDDTALVVGVQAQFYILFKSGPAGAGAHELSIALHGSDGPHRHVMTTPVIFPEGPDRGNATVVTLDLTLKPDQYWFHVSLDGVLYGKVPLQISQRQEPPIAR